MASSLSLALSLKPLPLSAQTLARPRFAFGRPKCDFAGKAGNGTLVVKRARTSDVRGSAVAGVGAPVAERKEERPIIVIDNYDSFTYNLCQYMGELGASFEVYRNDEITVEEMRRKNPRGILISPGPGTPKDSGISLQTVLELGPSIPLFGVCMGLQCIGEAFGGNVVRSPSGVVHGKSSLVYYDEKLEDTVFSGLPNPFTAARYHSLVIEKNSFPGEILEITAWTEDGLIMAARHKEYRHIQCKHCGRNNHTSENCWEGLAALHGCRWLMLILLLMLLLMFPQPLLLVPLLFGYHMPNMTGCVSSSFLKIVTP